MKRWLVVLWLLLLGVPGWAQEAERYENAQYGLMLDVPAGFVAGLADAAGANFEVPGRAVALRVWGEQVRGPFSQAVARLGRDNERDGWRVSEQTRTPEWAGFTAIKGARMRVVRAMLLCDRQSLGAWQLEFSAAEYAALQPELDRLGRGLRTVGC